MHSALSPAQQRTSPATTETWSVSDIVPNPNEAHSALLAASMKSEKASPKEPSSAHQQGLNHPTTTPHKQPSTSFADLVLDNITYDKILSSSAKSLSLASRQPPPTPPFCDHDARTPPNSPTSTLPNQSLMAASFDIMASETVTRSEINKTDF